MDEALELITAPDKPLLWRLGGHPLLPRTQALLEAQQQVTRLSSCLSVATDTSRVDAQWQPAGAAKPRVDIQQILLHAVASNQNSNVACSGNTNDSALSGGAGGFVWDDATPEERDNLGAAVATALAVDVSYRQKVLEGVSMLAFMPLLQTLSHGKPHQRQEVSNDQVGIADSDVTAAVDIPRLLLSQAAAKAAPIVEAATNSQSSDINYHLSPPDGNATLLPPSWMASSACRTLQVALVQLQHLRSFHSQPALLTHITSWALTSATSSTTSISQSNQDNSRVIGPEFNQMQLKVLSAHVLSYLKDAVSCCASPPADGAAYQQLYWLLQALVDGVGLSQLQLQEQLLPALVHDMWFKWQKGLWMNYLPAKSVLGPFTVDSVLGPAMLHTASQTMAVLSLLNMGNSDVSNKVPRLQQLRMAITSLSRTGDASCLAVAHASSTSSSWQCLVALVSQLLLAHVSSMPTAEAVAGLCQLAHHVLAFNTSSGVSATPELVSHAILLLEQSMHQGLRSMVQPVLAPLLQCLHEGTLQAAAAQTSIPAAGWHMKMAVKGHAWLLLGCARLHLVQPPAGIDPAGKYTLKKAALRSLLQHTVDPEIQVGTAHSHTMEHL